HADADGLYGVRFAEGCGTYEILVRSPGMVPARFTLRAAAGVLRGNVQLVPVWWTLTARPFARGVA
ncbi:MAG TPA: hypothetical protein VGI83_07845, partial [Gemmatimonadales bacterium]